MYCQGDADFSQSLLPCHGSGGAGICDCEGCLSPTVMPSWPCNGPLEADRKILMFLICSLTGLPTNSGLLMLSFPHASCQKTKGSVQMMRKHKNICEPGLIWERVNFLSSSWNSACLGSGMRIMLLSFSVPLNRLYLHPHFLPLLFWFFPHLCTEQAAVLLSCWLGWNPDVG